jgi:hypothetical protein
MRTEYVCTAATAGCAYLHTRQIFTATRHHAEYLHGLLQEVGLASSIIYGAMDMEARKVITIIKLVYNVHYQILYIYA